MHLSIYMGGVCRECMWGEGGGVDMRVCMEEREREKERKQGRR